MGILAAEAAARKVPVRDVPYEALKGKLRRGGWLLPQNDFGFIDSRKSLDMGRVRFPETIAEIEKGLASDAPGLAMWRVRQIEDRTPLYPLLEKTQQAHLPVHTAMALAPIKYEMAPMIRNAVRILASRRG